MNRINISLLILLVTITSHDISGKLFFDNILEKDKNFNFKNFKNEYEKKLAILKITGADQAYITKEEQRLILIEKDYQRDLDYSKDNKNCQNTSIRLINQKISYICLNKNKGNVIKSLPEFTYKLNDHNLIIK